MKRRSSTQDITWFLDLNEYKQLNVDPPYQRRSVWTPKDRQFFLDTIFRNYPSPAIFLHKETNDIGKTTYHVIDGKQRIQTILNFVNNNLKMAPDFGDSRLDGKRWEDIRNEPELKQTFWNYQINVELIDFDDQGTVNQVFDRLNRNSRKLTAQELRHAKYDGWLINKVEHESQQQIWKDFGISTTGRVKRMLDTQFISELMLIILENNILGFDQEILDNLYAKYDDINNIEDIEYDSSYESVFNLEDIFNPKFEKVKQYIKSMNETNGCIIRYAKNLAHFYSIWALVALSEELPDAQELANKYSEFMSEVEMAMTENTDVAKYISYSKGATTDFTPRKERLDALSSVLLNTK